jgi:multicomponent Na+:H+ antiporter subunit E
VFEGSDFMLDRASQKRRNAPRSRWPRFVWTGAIAALAWLGLNGNDLGSWLIGAPTALAAAGLGALLRADPRPRLRWRGLPPFAVFFLRESLRGGWDVAWRVFHPRLPVAPGFIHFATVLPEGPARHLFANVVSLLPGTVAAGFDGTGVIVHAIDVNSGVETSLRAVERRVARLFVEHEGAGSC